MRASIGPFRFPRTLIFVALASAFGLIEASLWYQYQYPNHAIPGRHQIEPNLPEVNKLFGEFNGSTKIKIPVDTTTIDFTKIKGIQLKTGNYGHPFRADSVTVVTENETPVCGSMRKFHVAENRWTPILLKCVESVESPPKELFLKIEAKDSDHWAMYQLKDGKPAIQFWQDRPGPNPGFLDARNYGELWNPAVLVILRIASRIAMITGIAFALFHLIQHNNRRLMLFALLSWAGLLWGQFFETITYHNSDETMHVAGAVKSVVDEEDWRPAYKKLTAIGGKVQFFETFAQLTNPIVPGRDGKKWISDNDYFVSPDNRSGLYSLIAKPITKVSLLLTSKLSFICSDLGVYMRGFMTTLVAAMVGLGAWFYIKNGRMTSFWVLLFCMTIPGVLASLLTIWNYSFLTVLGTIFSVNLIPEGKPDSRRTALFLSAALIPILGESARSQVLWFVIGPFVVSSVWIFVSERKTMTEKWTGIVKLMATSVTVYAVLAFTLANSFIPDRGGVAALLHKLSDHHLVPLAWVDEAPLACLGILQILIWTCSAILFFALDDIGMRIQTRFYPTIKHRLRACWAAIICLAILITLWKCWSIHEVSTLSSLAPINPLPPFSAHFKEAYRALMSQTFSQTQDYFLIQTFFMAYGWLEVTGNWFVYFAFRHLIELGILVILLASVKNFKTFFRFYLPVLVGFAIYLFGVWNGAWFGHFTIVGRFIFPAFGLLLFPMTLAAGEIISGAGYTAETRSQQVAQIIFVYMFINAVYGAFYVLPFRFIVGL